MKKIYLDRNIILDSYLKRNPHIDPVIAACKEAGYIFPYSPAHVEEIVGAKINHGITDFSEQLQFLKELSGEKAFCPAVDTDTILRFYSIEKCRANVEDCEGRNLTEYVVQCELSRLEKYKNCVSNDPNVWKKIRDEVAQHDWKTVFSNTHIYSFLEHIAIYENFRISTTTFAEKEATIELLYNVLDLFGFRKEENERKLENRLHDISHTIYAASSDIFVTNDERLNHKAKAIYNITSTKTQVLTSSEFITCMNKELNIHQAD